MNHGNNVMAFLLIGGLFCPVACKKKNTGNAGALKVIKENIGLAEISCQTDADINQEIQVLKNQLTTDIVQNRELLTRLKDHDEILQPMLLAGDSRLAFLKGFDELNQAKHRCDEGLQNNAPNGLNLFDPSLIQRTTSGIEWKFVDSLIRENEVPSVIFYPRVNSEEATLSVNGYNIGASYWYIYFGRFPFIVLSYSTPPNISGNYKYPVNRVSIAHGLHGPANARYNISSFELYFSNAGYTYKFWTVASNRGSASLAPIREISLSRLNRSFNGYNADIAFYFEGTSSHADGYCRAMDDGQTWALPELDHLNTIVNEAGNFNTAVPSACLWAAGGRYRAVGGHGGPAAGDAGKCMAICVKR